MSDHQHQPTQLRIGFTQPTQPARLDLTLVGLVVLVDTPGAHQDLARQHLAAVGVITQPHAEGGIAFSLRQLKRLAQLPEQVTVNPSPDLAPLWDLISNPPAGAVPANVDVDFTGDLELRWHDGTFAHHAMIPPSLAPALLAVDVPFVASNQAWVALEQRSLLPVSAGSARVNLDGFVEIHTAKPQMVEASPIPGLFRIDDTHFGVPLRYADDVRASKGFKWEGPPPSSEQAPRVMLPARFAQRDTGFASDLVERLTRWHGAVTFPLTPATRAAVVAAIEALDATPATVVCPTWAMWLWSHELAGSSLSSAVAGHEAASTGVDVVIAPYSHTGEGWQADAAFVVFDSPNEAPGGVGAVKAASRMFDSLQDSYRAVACERMPATDADVVELMSLVRPREFRPEVPVELRYPPDASQRLAEHVEPYVLSREFAAPLLGRSEITVTRVFPSDAQRMLLARLPADSPVDQVRRFSTLGDGTFTSPKLAAAVDECRAALAAGHRVVVLCAHQKTATMISAMLRPHRTAIVDSDEGRLGLDTLSDEIELCALRTDGALPALNQFSCVVVLDYPTSLAGLSAWIQARRSSSHGRPPAHVSIIHLVGSIDDRLAVRAASLS